MVGTNKWGCELDNRPENSATTRWRMVIYAGVAVVLTVLSLSTRNIEWSGFDELHTLIEASATILALIVAAMAFTRYYSRPEMKYLWLALAFLGVGFLDAYHTAMTTWISAVYLVGVVHGLAEWSEFASPAFLSIMFCLGAWASGPRIDTFERRHAREASVYASSLILLLACGLVFFVADLPPMHRQGTFASQPWQFLTALLFGVALIGFLRMGQWREAQRRFDHWIILALILGAFGHAAFHAFSEHQLDARFDIGHVLKLAIYICVLTGLLISMRTAFREAAESDRRFCEAVETLGEGFALYDAEDRLVIFNEAYLRLHPATRDFLHVGMKFEDFVRETVKTRMIEASIDNEEEYIRNRIDQHRNPAGPIVRELNNGTTFIINETRTAEGGVAVVETDITELNKVQAELAEKSGFLEATFDAMDDGISVWSADNHLLAFNQKFDTLMGREDDRAYSGMHIRELFMLNARAGLYGEGDPEQLGQTRYEGAMRAGPEATQFITFEKHGTYEVLRNAMPDGKRVTVHRNVTDRVAAEQRLAQVVENLCELFVLWDAQDRLALHNKRFTEVNAAVADIIEPGLPFEKFIRTGIERGMFPQALENPEVWLETRIREHRSPSGMYEIEREEGCWLLMHEQRLPDGGTVSISSDITAIKRAEAQVKEREQRLSAIVENVVDGIVTFDGDGRVLSANVSAAETLGLPADLLKGRQVEEFIAASDDEESVKAIDLVSGSDGSVREVNGLRADGEVFPMELAATKVDAEGEAFFVCIFRDISSRREMDRMKNEFVSTVSHELRTPLTSIRASLGLIVAGAVGEVPGQASELITIAERNAQRLIGLVNDILDMEKIEGGRMDFHFAEQTVVDVIRQAMTDNQGYADEHNVTFELSDVSNGATAVIDNERITQVMANLLSNAAKFSPPESTVQIRVSATDDVVRVSVIDAGSGIPDSFRNQVFEKFTQADSTDTRKVGGTGLGLSISRSIVERHGGKIAFENEPDAGANFYFDLPLKLHGGATIVADETIAAPCHRILICEDDPDVARLISMMLENNGYESEVAYSAGEAAELARSGRFDAMTVDLMLPDVDGLTLMRDLRAQEETKHLPIVVVSAAVDNTPDSVRASCMEIVDWLSKPIEEKQFMSAVAAALQPSTDQPVKILHVEDDVDLGRVLRTMLPPEIELTGAVNLCEAEEALRREKFDLVILDVFLPDGSGLDLLQLLRSNGHASTPTLLFSAEEVERTISEQVAGALVKSRTSNGELLDVISSLVERKSISLPT